MKRWKWSEKKVRYFLSKLKKKGMITTSNKQGMTIISLCNYDEYNPVKGNHMGIDKDRDWGIDKDKEINELKDALGELRAELRANAQEIVQKLEKMGQGKGKKKKKEEYNNIPPTPPKGDGLNTRARSMFEDHFRKVFGSDYYWTAKDAGNMSQLLQKLRFQREQKQMDVSDESILYALQYFLSSIKDGWIFENFSVSNINSKFNEIISQVKNIQNGSKSNQNGRDSQQRKINSVIAISTTCLEAAKKRREELEAEGVIEKISDS